MFTYYVIEKMKKHGKIIYQTTKKEITCKDKGSFWLPVIFAHLHTGTHTVYRKKKSIVNWKQNRLLSDQTRHIKLWNKRWIKSSHNLWLNIFCHKLHFIYLFTKIILRFQFIIYIVCHFSSVKMERRVEDHMLRRKTVKND